MTREERFKMDMIDEFKQMCEIVEKDGRIIENKRRMLKALSQEPICPSHGIDCEDCPAYDPCGDVISRQGVLDLAKKGILVSNGNYGSVCKAINDLPSVKPQEKSGKWVNGVCDNCKYDWGKDAPIASVPKYCPNCGAKMQEVEE